MFFTLLSACHTMDIAPRLGPDATIQLPGAGNCLREALPDPSPTDPAQAHADLSGWFLAHPMHADLVDAESGDVVSTEDLVLTLHAPEGEVREVEFEWGAEEGSKTCEPGRYEWAQYFGSLEGESFRRTGRFHVVWRLDGDDILAWVTDVGDHDMDIEPSLAAVLEGQLRAEPHCGRATGRWSLGVDDGFPNTAMPERWPGGRGSIGAHSDNCVGAVVWLQPTP